MALQYGLTPQGFVAMPQTEIVSELEAAYEDEFGVGIPTNVESRNGQHIVIYSGREASLWQAAQDVYSSQDPSQATGAQLDAVVALTGTTREGAEASNVLQTLTGVPGTTVPIGSGVQVPASGATFQTTAAATLVSVTAWSGNATITQGTRRTNGGNVYQATSEVGTTAPSGGPSGTGSSIIDGSVTWMFLGQGTAAVDVLADATTTGPVQGSAQTITQIVNPTAGWQGTINVLDADLGTNVQTDAGERGSQQAQLASGGSSAVNAIYAALTKVANVTQVQVYENTGDLTDSTGRPPHSVEAVVVGGLDSDVYQAIWDAVGGGIQTYGLQTGTVVDSQGHSQSVSFTRPTALLIYCVVTQSYDVTKYPLSPLPSGQSAGDAETINNILDFGAVILAGVSVFSSQLAAAILDGIANTNVVGVPGVLDTSVAIGTSPNPVTTTPVVVGPRQSATFLAANVTVNSSAGSP